METIDAQRFSLDLMEAAEAAYVTTIDPEGFPQTRAMFNLRRNEQFPDLAALFKVHQNDFLVYLTTNTSSPKIEHIRKNPKASIYYCEPGEFRGLMLSGELEVVRTALKKRKSGKRAGNCTIPAACMIPTIPSCGCGPWRRSIIISLIGSTSI